MPIAKWTRINPTTEQHMPTGVQVVKMAPNTDANPYASTRWAVRRPLRQGFAITSMRTSRNEAKSIAERFVIPSVREQRDLTHGDAMDEAAEREHASEPTLDMATEDGPYRTTGGGKTVLNAVVAPQLHPEDTPKWDPQRVLTKVPPAGDDDLAVALSLPDHLSEDETLAIFARLRRAELQLAAARAELIRRDAAQVLRMGILADNNR